MKKVFTFYVLMAAILFANAQLGNTQIIDKAAITTTGHTPKKFTGLPVTKKAQSTNRAATQAVMLDNRGADAAYADQIGTDFYYADFMEINKNYPNTTNLTHRWAAATYDSLVYLDANNNDAPAFLPRKLTAFTLDSIDVWFTHTKAAGNSTPDSIKIGVYDRTGVSVTANDIVGTKLWDTLIVTTTTIPLNVSNGGTPTFTVQTLFPNLTFAQGKTFYVKVDFAGDTADKFNLITGFRDDCLNACVASESILNSNPDASALPVGLYYINAVSGTTNLSGINSIQFQCGPPCNSWYGQNWWIDPWITATTQYGAAIIADSLRGCPGEVLNLNAFAFGSTGYTYEWATTSGSLTSTSDQQVGLVIGNGNATVTVTVTDGSNATTTATATVTSRGIGVTITGTNPLSLTCGSTSTIVTQTSGVQTGKTYLWNGGATTSTLSINTAGTYTVTVTNNSGCSASASLNVVYPGGVTNNVTFTNPPSPICEDRPVTFINTTTNQNGWTPQWSFGDGNLDFAVNGVNTYASPGVYTVSLQETNADGCIFKSANVNITVLAASNPGCLNSGIEDVTFASAINLLPNPTNGNVSVMVNGVEKNISIRVYNVIGSEVKSFIASDVASTFTKSFDFSDLANGTYLVKIQSADKTAVKRLTISK